MATTPVFGWDKPTVGADADTWGTKLNEIFDEQDSQLSAPANTIKGNNTGSTAVPINLTPAQAAAMLPAAVGASQGSGGTKGLVPAPTAGQQNRVLAGDGTFRAGIGRQAGCVITTTSVNGSQPTLANALNVASISTVLASGGTCFATITFTNALPDANYAVSMCAGGSLYPVSPAPGYTSTKTTTTLQISWPTVGGTAEISVSIF